MRVAVVTDLYDPAALPAGLPEGVRAGSAPYAGSFVREQAAALARRGLEVELLVPARYLVSLRRPLSAWRGYRRLGSVELEGRVRERYGFWPCRAFLTAPPFDAWALPLQARALGRLLDSGPRPDILHAHFAYPTACYTRLAAEQRGIPYVVTVHESYFDEVAARRLTRGKVRAALAGARKIACVSKPLRETVLRHFPELGRQVEVIPNGFDPERFHPAAGRLPGVGPARITFVGNLVGIKNLPVLFAAVEKLAAEGLDTTLTLAGNGVLRRSLEERASKLALRVRFLAAIPTDAVARLLREDTDVLVLPSRLETFGIVLVEALASGIPVVATRCGGPEDIVTDEVGRLVSPGDAAALATAIREVWERRAEFPPERLAAFARRRFSLESVAERWTAVYGEALDGRGGSGGRT